MRAVGVSKSLTRSEDSFEHFDNPWKAVEEVRRVLGPGGTLVLWVPFMHPFHGDDLYRYTPLALWRILDGFTVMRFETPLWVFSVIGVAVVEAMKQIGLGIFERPVKELARLLDRVGQGRRGPRAFAGAYLIVAVKGPEGVV